jgi:hypothetical protein
MPGSLSTQPAAETDTVASLRPAHAGSMPATWVTVPHFVVSAADALRQAGSPSAYLARPYFAVKLALPSALALIMKPASAAVASAGISSLSVFSACTVKT